MSETFQHDDIIRRLREMTAELAGRFPDLTTLYVFGSRARGAARAGSDLDVAICARAEADPRLDWPIFWKPAWVVAWMWSPCDELHLT